MPVFFSFTPRSHKNFKDFSPIKRIAVSNPSRQIVEHVCLSLVLAELLLNLGQLHYQAVKSKRKAREGSVAKVRLQAEISTLEKTHKELRTLYETAWAQELEARISETNRDMDARLAAVKSAYEIEAARIAAENEASEKQLADHVLQNEAELERLRGERNTCREQMQNALVRLVVPGRSISC